MFFYLDLESDFLADSMSTKVLTVTLKCFQIQVVDVIIGPVGEWFRSSIFELRNDKKT